MTTQEKPQTMSIQPLAAWSVATLYFLASKFIPVYIDPVLQITITLAIRFWAAHAANIHAKYLNRGVFWVFLTFLSPIIILGIMLVLGKKKEKDPQEK